MVDFWDIVFDCNSDEGFARLRSELKANFDELEKLCNGDSPCITRLSKLTAQAMAIGTIRGLQFGTKLGIRSGGTTAVSMMKHPSVKRLLLKGQADLIPPYRNGTPDEPKVDRRRLASTRDVCLALDAVGEPLPWTDLRKKNRLWTAWEKHPKVKMAVSNARKDAVQAATDEKFIGLVKGIGDEGTVFNRFEPKNRKVAKQRT